MVVRDECVRGAAASVEGEHSLPLQLLVERVARHDLIQLGEDVGVPAEGEFGVELGLQRGQALVGEPGGRRLHEVVVGEVSEHVAAPQVEGLVQLGQGIRR